MAFSRFLASVLGLSAAIALLAGCAQPSNSSASVVPASLAGQTSGKVHDRAAQGIQNVIVVVQQHRSFDNLFAGFPGSGAPTYGLTHTGKHVPLRFISLKTLPSCVGNIDASYFKTVYNDGKMNGWDLLDPKDRDCPYTRVNTQEIAPYWDLAKQYALGDAMFASTRFNSFTDSLYLAAGTTKLQSNTYAVGPPTSDVWGCDAPTGTITPILKNGQIVHDGPFPCFTQFPTIADLLDKANVGWDVYVDKPSFPLPFDPFDAIENVREGPDWKADTDSPASNVLSDLDNGKLRPVSFVLSPAADSDFPGEGGGPKWLQSIVQHAQKSQYWQHLAIVVVWDDFGDGSFYDNVAPPQQDEMGLGLRVPLLVISPHVKHGYISRTQYEYGSILKYIEINWNLGTLGATDVRATSIGDIFQ
ncbi:MAG TPA: alkaline phosphatase family protein [Candidatus Acidoferrum sp.]|nr:alkaline phosphatase family protein [Candidatus Acidoferrum sp.]